MVKAPPASLVPRTTPSTVMGRSQIAFPVTLRVPLLNEAAVTFAVANAGVVRSSGVAATAATRRVRVTVDADARGRNMPPLSPGSSGCRSLRRMLSMGGSSPPLHLGRTTFQPSSIGVDRQLQGRSWSGREAEGYRPGPDPYPPG